MVIKCRQCKKNYEVPVTIEQLRKLKSGILIQYAMPELSIGDRELLISKTCDPCFKELFKDYE